MHDSAARRDLPVTRGLLAGLLCAFGTTWAHTAMSGQAVSSSVLLVALGSLAACLVLARRRLGLGSLLTVCLAGQGAAHAAMSLGAMSDGAHTMSGMGGTTGMDQMGTGGSPMLLAHVAVAVLTALLAHGGEQALVDLGRRALDRLLLPTPPATPPGPTPTRRPAVPTTLLGDTQWTPTGPGSRGPPRTDDVLLPA